MLECLSLPDILFLSSCILMADAPNFPRPDDLSFLADRSQSSSFPTFGDRVRIDPPEQPCESGAFLVFGIYSVLFLVSRFVSTGSIVLVGEAINLLSFLSFYILKNSSCFCFDVSDSAYVSENRSKDFALDDLQPGYRSLTLRPNGSVQTEVLRISDENNRPQMGSSGYH